MSALYLNTIGMFISIYLRTIENESKRMNTIMYLTYITYLSLHLFNYA